MEVVSRPVITYSVNGNSGGLDVSSLDANIIIIKRGNDFKI